MNRAAISERTKSLSANVCRAFTSTFNKSSLNYLPSAEHLRMGRSSVAENYELGDPDEYWPGFEDDLRESQETLFHKKRQSGSFSSTGHTSTFSAEPKVDLLMNALRATIKEIVLTRGGSDEDSERFIELITRATSEVKLQEHLATLRKDFGAPSMIVAEVKALAQPKVTKQPRKQKFVFRRSKAHD